MDQARKPDRSGPKPVRRVVRINRRALKVVLLAGVLAVPALLGLKTIQNRASRSALLAEARRQRDEARKPGLGLGYFNRYLELAPNDLDAIDERAALLAGTATEADELERAVRAHVLLLSKIGNAGGRGPARKRLAGLYLRLQQFHAAEQATRDHLRLEPGDVEGRRLLARSLEGEGRMGDAKALEASTKEYEAAEALEPGDVTSGERLAALYLDKFGDKAKAIRVLDALVEHNPKSAPARLARARFFASLGDVAGANAEVDEAVRLDPQSVDARLAAAEGAARRGDPSAARGHLDAIQPPRPDDLRVKIILGQVELAESNPDQALRDWRDGLALADGSDLGLTWRMAHVLIQLGRPREAAPLMAQYRRLSGGDPSPAYRFLVGLASLKSGRTSEAVAELEAIRYKLGGGLESQLQMALGQAYEASLEPDKAVEAYAKAASLPGSGAAPWLALARLQAGESIAILERGVAAVGPESRLMAELARALWRKQAALPAGQRDWSTLDQILEPGNSASTGSVELVLVRADRASTASGKPEDGLAVLEAALKRDPGSARLRIALAEALASLGRVDEALAGLDGADKLPGGDQAGYRITRARIALARGEVKLARMALTEGIERIPASQRFLLAKTLGEFHRSQGDRPAARRAFLEWASLVPDSIEPHLALLNLAIEGGDDRSVDTEIEALKAIGGPSSPTWKVARAESLLRERPGSPPSPALLDEAARLVAEIEAATPRQPTGALLEARLMERKGQPDRAILAYEKAIELKAGPLAVGPLAALLAGLGRSDSLEALRSKVGGFSPEVERMLAARALRRGSSAEAEDLARRMVEGDPAGLDARAWQAKLLGDLGKPAEAEQALRQLVEIRPEASASWVQLVMFQAARKDRAGASETIERMKSRVKADRPDLLRATCCRAAGLRGLADLAFFDALRAFPDDLPTLRSAIEYYEETGRPDRAEPLLRKLRKSSPGLDWARRRLALNLASRSGDLAAWREALDLAGEESDASDTPDDRLTRALVLSAGPDLRRREAVAILEGLAAEMPDSPTIREALARAWLGVGERAKAREQADRAADAADAPLGSIRLAGTLDLASGDLDASARRLARLDALGLDDPSTLELRVRILKARGRAAEALATLEAALDAAGNSPDSAEFGRGLVRLLAALGEPDLAERMARKVARLGPSGQVILAEWLASRGRFDEASATYDEAAVDRRWAREAARSALALASMKRETRWSTLADRLLDRAIGAGPIDDEMAYARASLRHLQGRLVEAVTLYDDLAGRSSANARFLNNAAWILSEELDRPREGLARIEALEATASGADRPRMLDTRGVILLRLGQADRAINDLETADRSIASGPIAYHLARAYLAAGRRDDAAKTLARATAAGLKPESLQPSERPEFARVLAAVR